MRYRALDQNYDMTFGQGGANFLVNSKQCVGQLVLTRLRLLQGEWFLDQTEGTPYATEILGVGTKGTYDMAIKTRILGTENVTAIAKYSSALTNRNLSVTCTIDTAFGTTTITTSLSIP